MSNNRWGLLKPGLPAGRGRTGPGRGAPHSCTGPGFGRQRGVEIETEAFACRDRGGCATRVRHGLWSLEIEAISKPTYQTMSKSNRSNRAFTAREHCISRRPERNPPHESGGTHIGQAVYRGLFYSCCLTLTYHYPAAGIATLWSTGSMCFRDGV